MFIHFYLLFKLLTIIIPFIFNQLLLYFKLECISFESLLFYLFHYLPFISFPFSIFIPRCMDILVYLVPSCNSRFSDISISSFLSYFFIFCSYYPFSIFFLFKMNSSQFYYFLFRFLFLPYTRYSHFDLLLLRFYPVFFLLLNDELITMLD